jgi:hypothetical protein
MILIIRLLRLSLDSVIHPCQNYSFSGIKSYYPGFFKCDSLKQSPDLGLGNLIPTRPRYSVTPDK